MPAPDIATGHYPPPAVMTAPGSCRPLLTGLPRGVGFLVAGDAWRLCRDGHADPAGAS